MMMFLLGINFPRIATLFFLLLILSKPAIAELQVTGNVTSTTVGNDAIGFILESGAISRIDVIAKNLIRFRINPTGTLSARDNGAVINSDHAPVNAGIYDSETISYIDTGEILVMILKSPYQVVVFRSADFSLVMVDIPGATGWDTDNGYIFSSKFGLENEHFFGLGQAGGPVDRKGRFITQFNSDNGAYGEFTTPLYTSFPFYYGVTNGASYGVFFDNPAKPFFDMGSSNPNVTSFGAFAGELDYYLMTGPKPTDVAAAYAKLTGNTPLPPLWALGYHQSRFGYASQQEFLNLANEFRNREIPLDALYFDLHYQDNLQLFSWDPVAFPDPQGMNNILQDMGIRRVNILDPAILLHDRLWPSMNALGLFLQDSTGTSLVNEIFLGELSWIDFTKDAARDIYSQLLTSFVSTGVSAIWNDLNEPAQNFMPEAMYDFNGDPRSDLEARNLYALKEVETTYNTMKSIRPNERPWVLSRGGYSGIQRYAANWSGDNLSTFDSLRVSIQLTASMGISGQTFFGHDIGGFLGSPSAELFIRWLQFAAYTPFFRNHSMITSDPREPWQFGDPWTGIARDTINQRYRLLPYIYSEFERASRVDNILVSPTFFHFPQDAATYSQDDAFMLGESMLIAPVYEANATTRDVYLPAGVFWWNQQDDQLYVGGQTISVDSPIEHIPVFVKAGSIIPKGPIKQHSGENGAMTELDVYPGSDANFLLYEDDGVSFEYEQGSRNRIQLSYNHGLVTSHIGINPIESAYDSSSRRWQVKLHGVDIIPAEISINSQTIPNVLDQDALNQSNAAWLHDNVNNILHIHFDMSLQLIDIAIQSSASN